MTQTIEPTHEAGSSLVRVTVAGGDRRVDLALPGRLAVAEILPELCRLLGVLDPATAYAGYKLSTNDGRVLAEGAGLTMQGVEDGAVLTLDAGIDEKPPKVYDDIVEAMGDAVEEDQHPWDASSSRRTALATGGLLLALGGLALAFHRPDAVAGAAAGAGALVLIAAAGVLSRARDEPLPALLLAWVAVGYGAVAGCTAAPQHHVLGLPIAIGGAAAFIAGLIGYLAIQEHRLALVPGIVVGFLLAIGGGIDAGGSFQPSAVHTVIMVIAVLAGSGLPWLALGASSVRVEQAHTAADLTKDPQPIDPSHVRKEARSAHQMLLAVAITVGIIVVLTAPLAVHLGVMGALIPVLASLVLMLRTRQYRVGSEVAAGMISGILGLASTAVSIIVEHPSWRPVLAIVLAIACAVLLVSTLAPGTPSIRRGRLGDVAELVALVAMLPLLVFAIGLVGALHT